MVLASMCRIRIFALAPHQMDARATVSRSWRANVPQEGGIWGRPLPKVPAVLLILDRQI